MKKQWLAILRQNTLLVAKVGVARRNSLFVKFIARYQNPKVEQAKENITYWDYAALKNWFRKNRIPYKKLKFALDGEGLTTRVVDLPRLSEKDMERLVSDHIDQYFTLSIEHHIFDYRVLHHFVENNHLRLRSYWRPYPKKRWNRSGISVNICALNQRL